MKKIKVKAAVLAVLMSLVIVSAVFGSKPDGVEEIAAGIHFWNVEGSAKDHRIKGYSSWIDAWREEAIKMDIPDPNPNNIYCAAKGSTDRLCNKKIVGGHVVLNENQVRPKKAGATDAVYIFPICSRHNNHNNKKKMTTCAGFFALKLKDYEGQY
jgi:hypothetical protein